MSKRKKKAYETIKPVDPYLEKFNAELELVTRSKNGDESAFLAILAQMESFFKFICRLFYVTGKTTDDLENICREEVWIQLKRYNPKRKIRYIDFVKKCVRNRILTEIEKSKNKKNSILNNAISLDEMQNGEIEDGDFVCTPDSLFFHAGNETNQNYSVSLCEKEIIIREDFRKYVKKIILKKLTKKERRVIVYWLQGLSYEDIAKKTDYNTKIVDNAICRVKTKLIKDLPEDILEQYLSS